MFILRIVCKNEQFWTLLKIMYGLQSAYINISWTSDFSKPESQHRPGAITSNTDVKFNNQPQQPAAVTGKLGEENLLHK